jgi:VanZ family protein
MKILFKASGKRAIRRLVFLAYTAIVLGATLAPLSGNAYEAVSGLDKVVHVGLFGGVALLMCWNLAELTLRSATRVFVITVAFAALIELVQGTLWYRSGDSWDLLAGAFGAVIGVGFSVFAERIRTRPSD